jgi:hypothetical protein
MRCEYLYMEWTQLARAAAQLLVFVNVEIKFLFAEFRSLTVEICDAVWFDGRLLLANLLFCLFYNHEDVGSVFCRNMK